MVDDGLLGKIFSATSAAWAFVFLNAVALFKAWPNIMARINERRRDAAAEELTDWQRLREERDRLRDLLMQRDAEIAQRDQVAGEWMRRAITAEATLQGSGEAKQLAARIVALERLIDAQKRNAPEGK